LQKPNNGNSPIPSDMPCFRSQCDHAIICMRIQVK
jgi:hypothetical protein